MTKWWPFGLTFAGLLLKGKQREIAKISYELKGKEHDKALAEIEEVDTEKKQLRLLNIDRKYGSIDDFVYDFKKIDILIKDETQNELEKLKIERKFEHITKEEK